MLKFRESLLLDLFLSLSALLPALLSAFLSPLSLRGLDLLVVLLELSARGALPAGWLVEEGFVGFVLDLVLALSGFGTFLPLSCALLSGLLAHLGDLLLPLLSFLFLDLLKLFINLLILFPGQIQSLSLLLFPFRFSNLLRITPIFKGIIIDHLSVLFRLFTNRLSHFQPPFPFLFLFGLDHLILLKLFIIVDIRPNIELPLLT